jgi:pilus assembly protein FimV
MPIDRLVRPAVARLAVVLVVLAAGLQTPVPAQAARLGAVSVQSERGQPLRAEVEIEDATSETLAAEPAIVSPETYRDLGLTFPAPLRGARVTMERRDADGRPVIRIVGRAPTEGPELIVVMSLSTPAGRHLRSYRLDLDASAAPGPARAAVPPPPPAADAAASSAEPPLPTTRLAPQPLTPEPARMVPPRDVPRVEALPSAPAAVALPSTAAPSPSSSAPPAPSVPPSARGASAPGPLPATLSPPASAATASPITTPSITTRPVDSQAAEPATLTIARGDTAASIANRVRPADVTEAQAAMALYRNNPSAFAGSVSRPRPGATLRIPSPEQMRALPAPMAEQALRGQGASRTAAAPAGTSAPAPARIAVAERGDHLQLSAGGTGRGKQADARGGSAANREVAFEAAMTEARSRITQLESIVDGLKRLIAEREKQIAAMSSELRAAGVAVAPASTPVGEMPVPSAAGPSMPSPVAGASSAAAPLAPPTAQPPAPMAPAAPASDAAPPLGAAAATMLPAPTRRLPAPIPEPEPDPWYMDPMVLGGAGVGVLLLVLLAARMRGGKGRTRRGKGTGRFAAAR